MLDTDIDTIIKCHHHHRFNRRHRLLWLLGWLVVGCLVGWLLVGWLLVAWWLGYLVVILAWLFGCLVTLLAVCLVIELGQVAFGWFSDCLLGQLRLAYTFLMFLFVSTL